MVVLFDADHAQMCVSAAPVVEDLSSANVCSASGFVQDETLPDVHQGSSAGPAGFRSVERVSGPGARLLGARNGLTADLRDNRALVGLLQDERDLRLSELRRLHGIPLVPLEGSSVEIPAQRCKTGGMSGWSLNPASRGKPVYVGNLTNAPVYDRLPEGLLVGLREGNPVDPDTGRGRFKRHRFATEDIGNPHLRKHLAKVIA